VPGEGSKFCFTIRAEWVPSSPRQFLATARPHLRGKRVLVVENNETSQRILSTLIEKWGMTSVVEPGGPPALERLRAGEIFDFALLDMNMPEMDGLMVAREIRKLRTADQMPLFLLSSIDRMIVADDERVFTAILTKPVKPSQLYDAIAKGFASRAPFAKEPGAAAAAVPVDVKSEHVLLAEDNPVNQKVALHMLARLGYRADTVGNGLEALEAVERQEYDLILMDVQMPEMDGLEATRQIRARQKPGRTTPRVIALTADALAGDRERCIEAGMDDYLTKPIKAADLAAALLRARRSRSGTTTAPF
jgi:CheY-like chemotaxis protein